MLNLNIFPVQAVSCQEDGLPSYDDVVKKPYRYPLIKPSAKSKVKPNIVVLKPDPTGNSYGAPQEAPPTY